MPVLHISIAQTPLALRRLDDDRFVLNDARELANYQDSVRTWILIDFHLWNCNEFL
jgi:hypothetical protein